MLDLRQTSEYAKYLEIIGWTVERIDATNYFIKKLPLVGSFIKIQRPERISYKVIELLSKKYRAFQIVVEPKNSSQQLSAISHQFLQSKSPYLPTKTVHVDLTKSEKQLLKEMHYKTRYNIKVAQKNKVKVRQSKDIKAFVNFWHKCHKKRMLFLSQKKEIENLYKAFGKKAKLILGYVDNELVSGILMLRTNEIAYYMYAASTELGKKLFAPTLITWHGMKFAKKAGCKIFDFEGIYDDRFPLKSWLGFTRFKKSFGGYEVEYPGTFVKWFP